MTGPLTGSGGVLDRRHICEEAILSCVDSTSISGSQLARWRKELGAELAAFVVTQQALQTKAAKKLLSPKVDRRVVWCTDRAIQQATPWQVADLKSKWFGNHPALDLCCGIGGDATFLAARGPLIAVDSDPLVSELAALNLGVDEVDIRFSEATTRALSDTSRARVVCGDVTAIPIEPHWLVHIDPDRRPGSKRASRPDHYQPDWPFVNELLRTQAGVVVKLAPAAEPDLTASPPTHRCWISVAGSVREQTLLSGDALQHAEMSLCGRSAIVARSDGSIETFAPQTEAEQRVLQSAAKPLGWLIDPDPAIRAAGLTGPFCLANGLFPIGRESGFMTSEDPPSVGRLARSAKVVWSGSCDDRKLRREMRQRNVYPDVIKVRGTDHQPESLRKKYRKCGETPVQLWIGRGRDRVYAALAESSRES